MNVADVVLATLGIGAAPLLGTAWVLLRPRSPGVLGSRPLEALLVGPVLVALALHALLLGGHGPRVLALVSVLVVIWPLWRRRGQRPGAMACARALLLGLPVCAVLWFAVSTVPLLGDPADLWAAKAAAFKVRGALDLSPLGTGEVLARRNPFHPVGFPLLMNQALAWFPRFEPTLCRLPSVYFFAVMLVLCDRALAGRFTPWQRVPPVLALGVLPPVLAQGFDGHADLAVGVLALAAWLVILEGGAPVLAGVLAGGAGLIKLEGQAAALVGGLLLVAGRRWRCLPRFALGALPLLAVAWFVRPAGLDGQGPAALVDLDVYLQDPALLWQRTLYLASVLGQRLAEPPWPWLLSCAACALALCLGRGNRVSWGLLAAAGAWLCAVAYAYLRHPSFDWQVEVHHRRALVQVLPALWIAGSRALGTPPAADPPQAPGLSDRQSA